MTASEQAKSQAGTKASKPGTMLGVQMRGSLTAAYKKRGHGKADLALHYSFKAGRRDIQLTTVGQLMHFCLAESDADVTSINYTPEAEVARLAGSQFAGLVHASVTLKDGSVIWRRIIDKTPDKKALASDLASFVGQGSMAQISRLEVWTADLLGANPTRLRNGIRACAWIATARYWPLADHKAQVLELVRRREASFGQILDLGEEDQQALYGAAALELAFVGAVQHDLFEQPLTAESRFYPVRRDHV